MAAETKPARLNPHEAFLARFGVDPTPINISLLSSRLLEAMEQGTLAHTKLFRSDLEQAGVNAITAAVRLFPDGPVKSIYSQGYDTQPSSRNPGEKAKVIVAEFMDGNTKPLTDAFDEIADTLSEVSGVDLTFLKPHFLEKTPSELFEETRAEERRLYNRFWNPQPGDPPWNIEEEPDAWYRARKQAGFLQNGGILNQAQFAAEHAKEMVKAGH